MGGGLMQLVAYGAQDIYLTGQPQITFFKSVYRRHTNFAVESIQQTINGAVNPGSRVSVTISRNGDLLKNLWAQYNPSLLVAATGSTDLASDLSHALFQTLELEIGGQLIDRQYGLWLSVWRDLSECNPSGEQGELGIGGAEPGLNNPTSVPSTKYQRMSYTHQGFSATNTLLAPTEAYIPMRFWFCRNPGLAIPLIALQYHEVKFNIQFALATSYIYLASGTPNPNLQSAQFAVYADYVYLDTTERRQFAQNAHEYLIDQLQYQQESPSGNTSNATIRLNFNHPVKELIWVGTPASTLSSNSSTDITSGGATPTAITTVSGSVSNMLNKIILNGTDRFTPRNLKYFTRNQIWDNHTGFGATGVADSIAVYSFALRPEEHQPSGTCNFSRIDTAQLWFSNTSTTTEYINPITIFAVNYNVLRIMSGMGGLAYSN
uniref:Major capsid protein N-terminal domain-containing protein n=1 Tax=viral metagenome TaxID=1070528 RepID=A0A6C0B091_9ZZZZ